MFCITTSHQVAQSKDEKTRMLLNPYEPPSCQEAIKIFQEEIILPFIKS